MAQRRKLPPLAGKQLDFIRDLPRIESGQEREPRRRTVLTLIDDDYPGHVGYLIEAMHTSGRHDYIVINPRRERTMDGIDMAMFDAAYIDYSILLHLNHYISAPVTARLASFRRPIIRALQDEYRWVVKARESMERINISALISSLSPENMRRVYGDAFLSRIVALRSPPGFLHRPIVPERIVPLEDRRSLLSARMWDNTAFRPYYGRFMRQKQVLADILLRAAREMGVPVNIERGTASRVYGQAWSQVMMQSRGHLALEGGSTMFDLENRFEEMHDRYVAANPYAGYDEIHAAVFAPFENNVVHKVMTPRCIEAAALGTVIVGMRGEYSGYLQPDRDYIVIADDGSNARDVLEQLANVDRIRSVADNARRAIGTNADLTYEAHVGRLDALVTRLCA